MLSQQSSQNAPPEPFAAAHLIRELGRGKHGARPLSLADAEIL